MLRDGRKEENDNGVEVISITRSINFEENQTGSLSRAHARTLSAPLSLHHELGRFVSSRLALRSAVGTCLAAPRK